MHTVCVNCWNKMIRSQQQKSLRVFKSVFHSAANVSNKVLCVNYNTEVSYDAIIYVVHAQRNCAPRIMCILVNSSFQSSFGHKYSNHGNKRPSYRIFGHPFKFRFSYTATTRSSRASRRHSTANTRARRWRAPCASTSPPCRRGLRGRTTGTQTSKRQ